MDKQSVFLLSYLKYGDNDAILHCFTRENGFQSFFIKGVYSSKNKKKAYLIPLNELLVNIVNHSQHSKIPLVSKIEAVDAFGLNYDVKTSSIHFFIADFLNQVLKNEQQNEALYEEIRTLKNKIKQEKYTSHYIFILKILQFFGISPLLVEGDYLNVEKGEFQSYKESQTLDKDVSLIWKLIIETDFSYEIPLEKNMKKKFLDSVMLYYKNHFPGFFTPKSLSILSEIFQ